MTSVSVPELVLAVGALWGVVAAMAKAYDAQQQRIARDLRARLERCEAATADLRAETAGLLAAYQERDRAELERYRTAAATREGRP